jgi:anti-sigma factor RsiW
MSCLGARLAELADGRLDPVAADRALAHVAGCPACQSELAAQRRIHRLLAISPAPEPSESFLARLAAAPAELDAGTRGDDRGPSDRPRGHGGTGRPSPARPGRRVRRVAVAASGLAAVAVAITWGGSAVAMFSPPSPPGLSLVVPAVDRYTTEHAASTDLLPLTTPGSSIVLVSYGRAQMPVSPGDRAAVRLRVP